MFKKKNETVVCADGFRMSVQANQGAYCDPRNDTGPYTSAEIGFPNREEPMLRQWAEDPTDPTGTVYAWVPRDVILAVIARHGGMVEGELPEGIPDLWGAS
tara:strand:- start:3370 stop:3672 length:303 start_codon:yes stop_codon:yes gene_type:complete